MASIKETAAQFPQYSFETRVISDANWSVYRQSLLPGGDDIQRVEDNKVLSSMIAHGDDGTHPRVVDHFAYFSTAEEQRKFAASILKYGFEVADQASIDDSARPWSVRFRRIDVPNQITAVTVKLTHLAAQFDGEYDGWECAVTPSATLPGK